MLPVKQTEKMEREVREQSREKCVAKELKYIVCFSSDMNTCQSPVKPDYSKRKVQKLFGIIRHRESCWYWGSAHQNRMTKA